MVSIPSGRRRYGVSKLTYQLMGVPVLACWKQWRENHSPAR